MNDFAKEELKFFQEQVDEHITVLDNIVPEHEDLKIELDKMHSLFKKLQSMIDNYCEHKNTFSGSGIFYYCDDCGKVFI